MHMLHKHIWVGKWQKCEFYFGALTPWLAAWAGHELGGSAPHQCRWAGVVWAPRCRDCVMGFLRGLVVLHWTFVSREQSPWWLSGLDSCVLAYCVSFAPLLSLQSFYNYARGHCEAARSFFRAMHSVHLIGVEKKTALARGPRTVLGYVGKRGLGVEGYWCFRKWVQWSPCIGGAKCSLIASNERDVQSFLRLQRLLARFAAAPSFQACMRAFICTFCMCVCVYVYVCMFADMYICICMHVCMYLYIYEFIHMCMCMCMHICA